MINKKLFGLSILAVLSCIFPVQAEALNDLTLLPSQQSEIAYENWLSHTEQIRAILPAGLKMRLPDQIPVSRLLEASKNKYTTKITTSSSTSLTFSLFNCQMDSPSCLVGKFSVDSNTAIAAQEALKNHQATAIPISLPENLEGYLLESPDDSRASLIWEQDNMIYTVSLVNQERQTLIDVARSMANSLTIEAAVFSRENQPRQDSFSQLLEPEENPENESEEPPPPADIGITDPEFELQSIRSAIPTLQLQLRAATFNTTPFNSVTLQDNTAFVNTIALQATPAIGPDTRISANAGGDFVRYFRSEGYNSLNLSLGVLQEIDAKMYGELGWKYKRIYGIGSSQFLFENSARLALNRIDQLSSKLFVVSNYEFQANFDDPVDRSRISNSLGAGLYYYFTPKLFSVINYRLVYEDFTRIDQENFRNELGGQLIYQIQPDFFVGGSVAYLLGNGVDLLSGSVQQLNNVSFGIFLGFNFNILN